MLLNNKNLFKTSIIISYIVIEIILGVLVQTTSGILNTTSSFLAVVLAFVFSIYLLLTNINININDSVYKKKNLCDMPEISFSTIRKNSNYKDISNFIAIDVETTGLRPKNDDIIEISAVKFIDGKPLEYMSTFISPKKVIPPEATEINNITNEMVKDSPNISSVIDSFSDFIKGFNIIGYNLKFDLNFLFVNNLDLFSEKRKFYDLLPICRKHISKDYLYNYKLNTVCEYYDIYRNDSHRSMSDALATGLLFSQVSKEIKNTI